MTTRTMKMLLDAIEEQRNNPSAGCYVLNHENVENVEHFLRSFDHRGVLPPKGSRAALRTEIDALRAERVQLQAENEALSHDLKLVQTQLDDLAVANLSLRNDLARMPAGGPKLDDRDRELLHFALAQFPKLNGDETHTAVRRLLSRLCEQPVEADEVARMEDEGGPATPAEPNRAGWHGTWVAAEQRDTYGLGSKVKIKEGVLSFNGMPIPTDRDWVVQRLSGATHSPYTVRIGVTVDDARGFWIKPGDIAEVLK